jgi:hypothetical protein
MQTVSYLAQTPASSIRHDKPTSNQIGSRAIHTFTATAEVGAEPTIDSRSGLGTTWYDIDFHQEMCLFDCRFPNIRLAIRI